MTDYIDRSQWLPLKEVKEIADWAIKQGRKVFNNGSIIPSRSNTDLIDLLVIDGLLEGWKRDVAVSYRNLCDCAAGRNIGRGNESVETKYSPALKITAIKIQLTATHILAIEDCLFSDIKQNTLLPAIDALIEAMKPDNIELAILELRR